MDERETRAMMEDVAAVMKSLVSNAVTPIVSRLEALEKRLADLPVPKDGKDGKDADVEEVTIQVVRRPEFQGFAAEIDGIKAAMADGVSTELFQEVKAEIERLKNLDHALVIAEKVAEAVDEAIAALPPAEKGKDADPVEVAAQIAAEVERAVAVLPAPKDGQSVTLDDVRPLIDEAVTKAVTLIPIPKDGIDGKDGRNGLDAVKFFRDANGHLIVVKSDGSTDDLGEYVGKDGAAGLNGKDGLDGVGFDDMSLVFDEEGILIKFVKGENIKQERLPVPFYRGVFKEGQTYHAGNCVSYGGSTWIAHVETADKPDGNTKTWQLSTKRGRDGKDGIMKDPPKGGPVKVG